MKPFPITHFFLLFHHLYIHYILLAGVPSNSLCCFYMSELCGTEFFVIDACLDFQIIPDREFVYSYPYEKQSDV